MFFIRDDSADSSFELIVSLPTVNVVRLPVCLQLNMPTDISVESLMTITYSLQNNTDVLHDVDISVESTEAFMFAGHRQVTNYVPFHLFHDHLCYQHIVCWLCFCWRLFAPFAWLCALLYCFTEVHVRFLPWICLMVYVHSISK